MGRWHAWVGWIALITFLATGHYMRYVRVPPVEELDPGLRMLIRSRHIYLLFSALLNLAAAGRDVSRAPRWLVAPGGFLLLISPVIFTTAFVMEGEVFHSPTGLSQLGVQAAFAGALCYVVAGWVEARRGA